MGRSAKSSILRMPAKYFAFDQVVLKKPHLRDGDTSPPSLLEHLYPVQLAQLVTIIFILLLLMILVLILNFLFIIFYSLHQGNGHPSIALHVAHPALHTLHPRIPQAPGQDTPPCLVDDNLANCGSF